MAEPASSRGKSELNAFIEKAFWALCIGISSMGVKFLGDLSLSVNNLNKKVEVIMSNVKFNEGLMHDYGGRISSVESQVMTMQRDRPPAGRR